MDATMDADEWQQGMIWLPAFFPHVAGKLRTQRIISEFLENVYFG